MRRRGGDNRGGKMGEEKEKEEKRGGVKGFCGRV